MPRYLKRMFRKDFDWLLIWFVFSGLPTFNIRRLFPHLLVKSSEPFFKQPWADICNWCNYFEFVYWFKKQKSKSIWTLDFIFRVISLIQCKQSPGTTQPRCINILLSFWDWNWLCKTDFIEKIVVIGWVHIYAVFSNSIQAAQEER